MTFLLNESNFAASKLPIEHNLIMKKIQHLYWRAGFGLSPREWEEKKNWTVQRAVDDLFQKAEQGKNLSKQQSINKLKNPRLSVKEQRMIKKEIILSQNVLWVNRMASPKESALLERMTLFWHGHFACEIKIPFMIAQYVNSIQQHALGNFRDLVVAIAKDPSMIRYLNNQQNRKGKPNENFARELMELFTIGRGNYTEQDIKESARAFTGWSSTKEGTYVFRERQHDFGRKTFMGKSGNYNGEDIIDIILQKRATATFITRKIYRYFVNEQVNETRIKELANLFYQSNYDIGKLMKHIFSANWFYENENVGTKIKAPVELLVGMMRQLDMSLKNQKAVGMMQRALGQNLFNPPNVAGWPGGKAWIDNSTLMLRLNFAALIFQGSDVSFKLKNDLDLNVNKNLLKAFSADLNLQSLFNMTKQQNRTETFAILSEFLLQAPSRLEMKDLEGFVARTKSEDYTKILTMRLLSLPEYQMC